MPANNIRILSVDERKYLNDKYLIYAVGSFVLVITKDYNRTVMHKFTNKFLLTTKEKNRRLTINPEAMSLWMNYFKETSTLIDVQQAVNILRVTLQDVTKENVEMQLSHLDDIKVKLI